LELSGYVSASVEIDGLQANVTVYYDSVEGLKYLVFNIHYSDSYLLLSSDIVYNSQCDGNVRATGNASVLVHGVADSDLASQCAIQLFSGCGVAKLWGIQCTFDVQSIQCTIFLIAKYSLIRFIHHHEPTSHKQSIHEHCEQRQ
jgi:hypothetical protein